MSPDSTSSGTDAVPSVSVVIPTKNRRMLLRTSLAGVLAQRDVDLEVVVVDDGSTDGTADALTAMGDPRVRVLRHPASQGVVAARNRGLAASTGDWVAFCDDDDLWAPDKLVQQLAAAARSGRAWAVGGAVGFESDGAVLYATTPAPDDELAAQLPWRNAVPGGCSNVVARRRLLEEAGGFDPRFRVLADWELWIRLARHGAPASLPAAVVGYRMHGSNMSTSSEGVLEELRLVETLSADLRDGRRLDPGWFHYWMATSMLRGGDSRGAAGAFWRAASLRRPAPLLRALVSLTVPVRGRALARRVKNRRSVPLPTPPWLADLLAEERAGGTAGDRSHG
ncbi:glycosyltransferase family 2 protein [Blastococcus capsensis]|uniref:glycosyltransferase family 2 protein n=1 Tax=Blastococcus capsensis TaxID=1564163 RepID=UPI002540224D|nr:glycosyltransferase family A protein [Blastococcus capsensis]MDK3256763.1 glycosyltransferase family A protein [Blastococcus capsensis]